MLKKNDKLLHGYFNELKERLNAELAKRGGQGSVYGYQNKIDIAQIAGDVSIDQWAHTQGTDINTGISHIQSNTHYTLASEMNDLLDRVASWETRNNITEEATEHRPANPNTTTNTHCNVSCTGLCKDACFSGCTGTCQVTCATTCGKSCSGYCLGSNGSVTDYQGKSNSDTSTGGSNPGSSGGTCA